MSIQNAKEKELIRQRFFDKKLFLNLRNLPDTKMEQLKKLRLMVEDNLAVALYFYRRSKLWKKIYWVSAILNILLTATNSIINSIFKDDEINDTIPNYNAIFSALLSIGISIIAILNASSRKKEFELAGDRYFQVSEDIFNQIFFANEKLETSDLYNVIEIQNMKLSYYREIYTEPSPKTIETIKSSVE